MANVYRTRRGKSLEPGCDVHGISVDVAVIGENISGIDADPQSDPIGSIGLALGKAALDIEPAADRIKRAREHNECSVPHATHGTAAMSSDGEIDQLANLAYHARVGAVLVAAHHAAIADNIREQYRRQAAGGWRGGGRLDAILSLIGSVVLSDISPIPGCGKVRSSLRASQARLK